MASCPRIDEFEALAAAPTAEQAEHLLGCRACRATLGAQLVATEPTDGGGGALAPVPLEAPGRFERQQEASGEPVVLGRGGFARVVLARDTLLGRDLALKVLRSRQLEPRRRAVAERRLLQEARVVGQLEHPSIVPLHDLVRTGDGQLVSVMRRIRGRTLAEATAACATLDERLRLLPHVLAACHAVAYAHSRGVVHRDLKPQNVMVDRYGETLVIDWGLARAVGTEAEPEEEDDDPARSGAVRLVTDETVSDGRGRLGTPAYMSPEQLTGVRGLIDERSDVWGLGALLFSVLTGRAPRQEGPLTATPPRARALEPALPDDLAALCDKALAESREARYPSAEALAADLDAWLHGQRVTAHDYRPLELFRRFVRANRVTAMVGGVGLLLLVAVALLGVTRVQEERDQARHFATTMAGEVLQLVPLKESDRTREDFTARVTSWLRDNPDHGDLSDAAWAWAQLSRQYFRADRLDEGRRANERCFAMVAQHRGPRTPRLEAAEVSCAITRFWFTADRPLEERLAALRRVEAAKSTPLPRDAEVLEAYGRVATVFAQVARDVGQLDESRTWALRAGVLARECTDAAPGRYRCWERLADASVDLAYMAVDALDGPGALRHAEEQLAAARRAFALEQTVEVSESVVRAIVALLVIDQYFPGLLGPEREPALFDEALRLGQAAVALRPGKSDPGRMLVDLLLIDGRAAEAFAAGRELPRGDLFTFVSNTAYAALMAGQAPWVLDVLATDYPRESTYDVEALRALASLEVGRLDEAGVAARKAAETPFVTTWPLRAMERWAAAAGGHLAPERRALVAALTVAQRRNDATAAAEAWRHFARALDGAK